MKKKLPVIIINIFLFLLLFIIFDFTVFVIAYEDKDNIDYKTYIKNYIEYVDSFSIKIHNRELHDLIFAKNEETKTAPYHRPIENPDAKKSIILFGCSFTFGYGLTNEETFSHQLAKLVNYKIYNRGFNGRSTQHMLYQLENDDFYKIMPKPDYIIYTFIPDQVRRTFLPSYYYDRSVFYKKDKDNKLVLKKYSFNYLRSAIIDHLEPHVYNRFGYENHSDKEYDFYFLHLYQSLDAIKKHWGNDVKFIFFAYENSVYNRRYFKILKDLENKGVIVVRLTDLSKKDFYHDKKYKLTEDNLHPNAKAWEEITPLFVKYLQKRGELK